MFSSHSGIEVASAGTERSAENPVSPEIIEWADLIFVMERRHRNKLSKNFRAHLKNKRMICLDIPDDYEFMDLELIELLKARVSRYLG